MKFCNRKNIKLTLNDSLKEEHLDIKKLCLSRKGDSAFTKNLLNFIKGNSFLNPLVDTFDEMEDLSNTVATVVPHAKKALKIVRMSNIN